MICSFKPVMTRLLPTILLGYLAMAMGGCQTIEPTGTHAVRAKEFAPSAPADPVPAMITEAAPAYAHPTLAHSSCEMPAGATRALRFTSGRYAVESRPDEACAAAGHTWVWVEKRFVEIADTAYAPFLERVHERPGLVLEMNYAGDRIFCDAKVCLIREPLYGRPRCYLAPQAAAKLREAAAALQARDTALRLRVYDCYRPIDVQIEMFSRVGNPVWVAEPKPPRYGGHNRGIAVDFTIERDGVALDMGSAYDLFAEISNFSAKGLGAQAVANRKYLRDLMVGLGLRPYDGEWWHFSLPIDTRAMNFPL